MNDHAPQLVDVADTRTTLWSAAAVLLVAVVILAGAPARASALPVPGDAPGASGDVPGVPDACPVESPQVELSALRGVFEKAVALFNSPQQAESEPLFKQIIETLQPNATTLSPDLTRLLVQSLAYRAQVRFNNSDTVAAVADLRSLVLLDPGFEYAPGSASAQIVAELGETRRRNVGKLVLTIAPQDAQVMVDGRQTPAGQREFQLPVGIHTVTAGRPPDLEQRELPVEVKPGETTRASLTLEQAPKQGSGRLRFRVTPREAVIWLDGAKLAPGLTEIPVKPGSHTVMAGGVSGYVNSSKRVTALADQIVEVAIRLEPTSVTTTPEPPPPHPFVAPRRVLIRWGLAYQTKADPYQLSIPLSVYSKPMTLTADYALETSKAVEGQGREFGGTVRVWKRLAVGVTRTQVSVTQSAQIAAQVPYVSGSSLRSLSGSVTGLNRTEVATHLEIAATSSSDHFEASVFIGPTWFRVTDQDIVGKVKFLDYGSRVDFTGADTQPVTATAKLGFNLGADVSWLVGGYVGLGASIRYSKAELQYSSPVVAGTPVSAGRIEFTWGVRFRF